MSEEKDEGGIVDFLAKVVFTVILVYVASYFSGYHDMVMSFLKDTFQPAIKAAKDTSKAVDIELKRRGIHVSNKGIQYVDPTKSNNGSNSDTEHTTSGQ